MLIQILTGSTYSSDRVLQKNSLPYSRKKNYLPTHFSLKRFSLLFLGKVDDAFKRNYFNTLLSISECCREGFSSYVLCHTA